jgi:hypothetical protein
MTPPRFTTEACCAHMVNAVSDDNTEKRDGEDNEEYS